MRSKISLVALSILSSGVLCSANAATEVDAKREEIVIFSRQGEAQLNAAIPQLKTLYQQTNDSKVRDDLIALLMRQSHYKEAIAVCSTCSPAQFSENELENLARAYRNEKQFEKSLTFYTALRQRNAQNRAGWLGSALVETELNKFQDAKKHLNRYQALFGKDASSEEAMNILLDKTDSDLAKLGRWQKQLKQQPKNTKLALELYRLAAKYNIQPLQQSLMDQYPDLFSEKDKEWFEHNNVIISSKAQSVSKEAMQQNYAKLGEILAKTPVDNPLYQQTLQDRVVIASKLGDFDEVEKNYAALDALGKEKAGYVKEAYADVLLAQNSPFKALEIYQELEQAERNANRPLSSSLLYKLMNAASDAGYFEQAQNYLSQIKPAPLINDYTRRSRIHNPEAERHFFETVNLTNWRGDKQGAIDAVQARLNDAGGDVWAMLMLSSLERERGNYLKSNALAQKASTFFSESDQIFVKQQLALTALSQGDWRAASEILNNLNNKERQDSKALLEQYDLQRSAKLVANFSLQRQTPNTKVGDETSQDYYLYSPKTEDGHSLYAHYAITQSPTSEQKLRQQRLGVGAELNFYPFIFDLEAGKGVQLNDKSYYGASLSYALNDNWHFALSGNVNGANTPVKAINDGIYTKDFGLSIDYSYNDWFSIGAAANQMNFDDGNRRRSYAVWANADIFQIDRWKLASNMRWDLQRNKQIDNAAYYNPEQSRNIELGADLSYYQPLDYGLKLTHHLKGSVGRYAQTSQATESSWSLSYGQQWNIKKRVSLSYAIGRKKNIYDGEPEFNNFLEVGTSVLF